jgi:hypothetical protein
MAAMAKKGCTPNKFAKTLYLLSIISIFTGWFGGIGILLGLATLILSVFAASAVVKEGTCVEENLAIVHAAQRNCWILLLIYLLVMALFAALIFYLLVYLNGY